tara:strand:+ start:212 stop:541 length:330 start_codon:yes stop_codon:yes gene_type:complete
MTTYASFPVTEDQQSSEVVFNGSESSLEAPIVRSSGKGYSITALVCGIVGFVFLPYILGPLAIIFGALGMKRDGRGMAIAGLVLGIVQVVILLLVIALVGAMLASGGFY